MEVILEVTPIELSTEILRAMDSTEHAKEQVDALVSKLIAVVADYDADVALAAVGKLAVLTVMIQKGQKLGDN